MAEEGKNQGDQGETPEERGAELSPPPELMEAIPEEMRPRLRKAFHSMEMSASFPARHPLVDKLNSQHIDKIIDYSEQDDIRQADTQRSGRRYMFAAFIVLACIFVGLLIFFQRSGATDQVVNLIIGVLSLAGGFGLGRYFQRERS